MDYIVSDSDSIEHVNYHFFIVFVIFLVFSVRIKARMVVLSASNNCSATRILSYAPIRMSAWASLYLPGLVGSDLHPVVCTYLFCRWVPEDLVEDDCFLSTAHIVGPGRQPV